MICLVEYDGKWRTQFEQERSRLVAVTGGVLRNIEHFGSTAIPGLSSKPVLDLMAPVPSLDETGRYSSLLEPFGYVHLDAGFAKRLLFVKRDDTQVNLHLVLASHWRDKNELLFRDWLLKHPKAVQEYEELKRELAQKFSDDMEQYTQGKSEFVRWIVSAARAERGLPERVDWSE